MPSLASTPPPHLHGHNGTLGPHQLALTPTHEHHVHWDIPPHYLQKCNLDLNVTPEIRYIHNVYSLVSN